MTPQQHQARIQSLKTKLQGLRKEAFAPPGTPPPPDPLMAAMGGAPVDPSMMGGAPMPPAGGAPVDPAMMAAMGGAPVDPSMMGGAAPAMDPAMDPAMAAALAGAPAAPAAGAPAVDPMADVMERVDAIGYMVMKLCEALNVPLDQAGDATAAAGAIAPEAAPAIEGEQQDQEAAANPLSGQAQDVLSGEGGYIGDQVNKLNA